jgi:3'(2'), 5'-bisphosphate nucleotidase
MNLSKELEIATELAFEAGKGIMNFYASGVIAEVKLGVDNFAEPVTIADKTASKLIVKGLAKHFPGDAILSEEEIDNAENRILKSRTWMIDPIDGTKGFIEKNGDFAVQIGLTENGESILGIVFLPFENILYFACKGNGAFTVTNDGLQKSLQVSDKKHFAEMILATSRNHHSPRMTQIVEDFGLKQEIQRGSVGLKVGLISTQVCDLYIHLSPLTKFWDTCAPQIILEESGGKMTDIFGDPLRYDLKDVQNHNGILASNGVTHDKTVQQLRPLLNRFGRFRIKSNYRD